MNRRKLPSPQQARELHRVAPIGLDPISRTLGISDGATI
jgi:hypothetical protein